MQIGREHGRICDSHKRDQERQHRWRHQDNAGCDEDVRK